MITPTTTRAPSYADEKAIREHYQRMLDSWELGASAYAECFTPDATYTIGNGKVQYGWQEIVEGHEIIFSAWARNSRLEGRIDTITYLTPDVAQLVCHGHIVYKDHRSSDHNSAKRQADGGWAIGLGPGAPLRRERAAIGRRRAADRRCRERAARIRPALGARARLPRGAGRRSA